ncbi:CDP-alcohol phosphatidyltransferase family protein [Candidatus Bathyarchaeota archaeon]|nr:CDP-alcohol phosphatidyltransferase family protein [Candidatus Bathyarchaeota archaeon]
MLGRIKEKIQKVLNANAKIAIRLGITPSMMGLLGLAFAASASTTYYLSDESPVLLYLAGFLVLASGLCDALDGSIARLTGRVSKIGAFMDSMLDRYSEAFILCGIILGGLVELSWGLFALVGSLLVSYARARGESLDVEMLGIGIMERAERLLIISFASFLRILNPAIIAVAILTHLTVLQRILHVERALSKDSS